MKLWAHLQSVALLGVLSVLSTDVVLACSFHMTLPTQTMADKLFESENVVIAREDPSRPFHYAPVETLKGVSPSEAMPNFVDSATRRRLAANPEHGVVFVQTVSGGQWTRLAYLDDQLRPLVISIVDNAAAWAGDASGTDRFRFFAALHDHPNRQVNRMALSELDRASYRLLRSMEVRASAHGLRKALMDPNQAPFVPVRILLLGILGDAESRIAVDRSIEVAARHGLSYHLGAWAAAAIEIDGAAAVDRLSELFLEVPSRSIEQVTAILTAFALHAANGDPELKPLIDAAAVDLLARRPALTSATRRIFAVQRSAGRDRQPSGQERTLLGYRGVNSGPGVSAR